MYTIDLFMWGFQQHFQISLQFDAERLFNQIDPGLKPKVFMIGILTDQQRTDRHQVCLEPEDCGYSVKAFAEVKALAIELEKVDEERNIFHTHPQVQESHEKRISNRALMDAITKILKRDDHYGLSEKFISHPTYVDGFLVFVVLEIQKKIVNKYYSLVKNKMNDRYTIQRSFIESAVNVFLKESSNALKDPNQGYKSIDRPAEELLREAGKDFMYTVSQAGKNFFGLHGLYDACNTISSLKYEGSEGLGKMIIAAKDHDDIKLTLQLKDPIRVNDYRKVRKFLELTNTGSMIIADSRFIYGLGQQIGEYNPKDESLFIVNFLSHYKWEVLHDNHSMMVVEYRQPNLPKEIIDKVKFYSDLRRVFIDIQKNQLDDLWVIVNKATKQKHGTMLVISDKAQEESIRLGGQSFALDAIKLNTSIIQQVTTIDGAVLMDKSGFCHAIGVILDGIATEKGDASRGARFNSAIRYYEHFGKLSPTVIIIISEDGMINLVPDLLPQIKHSLIVEAIGNLEKLSSFNKLKWEQFQKTMNFLEGNKFYLTSSECDAINKYRAIIEVKEREEESPIIKIGRENLVPNEDMNDTYYVQE